IAAIRTPFASAAATVVGAAAVGLVAAPLGVAGALPPVEAPPPDCGDPELEPPLGELLADSHALSFTCAASLASDADGSTPECWPLRHASLFPPGPTSADAVVPSGDVSGPIETIGG